MNKEDFLKRLPSHYAEADPARVVCNAIIERLADASLTFAEIYDDPGQLDRDAGVPTFIHDEDVIAFARLHAFDLQLLANDLHFDRNVKIRIEYDPRLYAVYLVKTAIRYLRSELEAFKEDKEARQ